MAVSGGNMVHLLLRSCLERSGAAVADPALSSIAYTFVLIGRQILNAAGCAGISLVITTVNAALYFMAMLLTAAPGSIVAAAAGGVASSSFVPIVVVALRWKLGLPYRRILSDQVPIWNLAADGSECEPARRGDSAGTNGAGLLAALLAKVAIGVVVFTGAVWLPAAPEVFSRAACMGGLTSPAECACHHVAHAICHRFHLPTFAISDPFTVLTRWRMISNGRPRVPRAPPPQFPRIAPDQEPHNRVLASG